MEYLLDTNVCTQVVMGERGAIERLQTLDLEQWAISSLVFAELQFGLEKGRLRASSAEALKRFLAFAPVASFDRSAAAKSAWVRAELERKGQPTGAIDQLIAGQALDLNATLVTRNTRHFKHIPGVRLESWL